MCSGGSLEGIELSFRALVKSLLILVAGFLTKRHRERAKHLSTLTMAASPDKRQQAYELLAYESHVDAHLFQRRTVSFKPQMAQSKKYAELADVVSVITFLSL